MKIFIVFNCLNRFFTLLGQASCWKDSHDQVFLLRQIHDKQIFAVPDYIFYTDFINVEEIHTPLYLKQLGWTEFEIKKLEINYTQLLKDHKHLSSK